MKVFTSASIVSVAGIAIVAVACSSSSTGGEGGGDGGTSSSGGSSGTALIDGGGGTGQAGGKCQGEGSITVAASPGGDAGGCPKDVTVSSASLDKDVGWHCPSGKKGSCTNEELAAIAKNFDDTSVKSLFDITKDASDTCKACAVSKETDSAWAPIVGFTDSNGETGILNYGACFGFLIGATCGRSVQYLEFCIAQACSECAMSDAQAAACAKAASEGACKGFVDSVAKECPLLANAKDQCSDIMDAVKTVCGP